MRVIQMRKPKKQRGHGQCNPRPKPFFQKPKQNATKKGFFKNTNENVQQETARKCLACECDTGNAIAAKQCEDAHRRAEVRRTHTCAFEPVDAETPHIQTNVCRIAPLNQPRHRNDREQGAHGKQAD